MTEPSLSASLRDTLVAVARRLADATDPWWVIGSTATVLHGLDAGPVGDVDVVASAADARRLAPDPDVVVTDEDGTDLLRSDVFAHLTGLQVKVEILGGLHVRGVPLTIATREPVCVAGATVYVPAREELIRILRLFGRPKDIERAEALAGID